MELATCDFQLESLSLQWRNSGFGGEFERICDPRTKNLAFAEYKTSTFLCGVTPVHQCEIVLYS